MSPSPSTGVTVRNYYLETPAERRRRRKSCPGRLEAEVGTAGMHTPAERRSFGWQKWLHW